VARYCSAACQKADWKEHKKTCKCATFEDVVDYCEKRKLEGVNKFGDLLIEVVEPGVCAAREIGYKCRWDDKGIDAVVHYIEKQYAETRRGRTIIIQVVPWNHADAAAAIVARLRPKYKVIDLYMCNAPISAKALYEADIAVVDPWMIPAAACFHELRKYDVITTNSDEMIRQITEAVNDKHHPRPMLLMDCPEIPRKMYSKIEEDVRVLPYKNQ
jgi:hypothetical protein